MRIIKIKPLSWFQENAYKDDHGDWWESEEICDNWETDNWSSKDTGTFGDLLWVYAHNIGTTFNMDNNYPGYKIDWAIEKEYTKEEYPEFYL